MLLQKKNIIFLIILFLLTGGPYGSVFGQELKGGRYEQGRSSRRSSATRLKMNKTDVFPLERTYLLGGPSIAPGITYTFPGKESSGSLLRNDTNYTYEADPGGKIGLYFEVSWFHSFADPVFFHYIDFGLSYKQFKGEEKLTAEVTDEAGQLSTTGFNNTFRDQFLSAHFNATHHYHFSRYGFVNNSIGINVDYNLSSDREGFPLPGKEDQFPEELYTQLHYKLGIGWKAAPQLLIIPSIETPILNVYPFDDLKSTLPYFSSRYRPFIISIRFLFIRKDLENCNVPNYDGPANFQ